MTILNLGPYTTGEIPPPVQYQFLDANGAGINITGYAVKFVYQRRGASSATTRDAALTTAASGIVTWTPVAADVETSGVYYGYFWVGNGAVRYASPRISYAVVAPVGSAPAI